jgi:hypothetical protein
VARFELYENRKAWWWVFFLSLAVAKDKADNKQYLVDILLEAIDYQDNYDKILKSKEKLNKYDIKGPTK